LSGRTDSSEKVRNKYLSVSLCKEHVGSNVFFVDEEKQPNQEEGLLFIIVFDTQAVHTPDGRISTLHEAAVFFDRGEYRPRVFAVADIACEAPRDEERFDCFGTGR
jgi:hypothetical protein